ncbi:hypothetical protein KIPE111705_41040 [Kibdelosporangium persicum]|uniref:Uncharacterized protein n=1 Tax=Kibdelosporangium persicum TaxID=2698649 RepID=A0ABX2FKF3_9PSEU|nr:hypothetical protein [Kibdelosporangium persicum]NRN71300.1 hypothetical protein [Kibdelosporangium persicum]
MRLIRLGNETSAVGADVRAALASWGRGEGVVGGVALIGCRPPDCPDAVDAIVILPRGILVVVGVDLPDPAMRLDAPVNGQWKVDGWPLVRSDGAVNPAAEAVQAATAVVARLQAQRAEPVPVGTVIAVGPYVSRVSQPTSDLARGIRILHPEPTTLLTAARELAVYERRCSPQRANAILAALAPDHPPLSTEDLMAEGFANSADPGLAAASTLLIPRVAPDAPRPVSAVRPAPKQLGWLPVTAVLLVGLLMVVGIIVAIAAAGDEPQTTEGPTTSVTVAQQAGQVVDGVPYTPKGTVTDTDCPARAFGDMQVWLQANRCVSLTRARYESTAGNEPIAVLVADLTFQDATVADAFLKLAAAPGTGSITDPSVQGTPWPDDRRPIFESAAYQAKQTGSQVRIVQVVWLDKAATPDDPDLLAAATRSLNLPA